jgi:hypothetical protein
MSDMSAIESIIDIQAGLMDAIDSRDVGRIEQATKDLARAIGQVRYRGPIVGGEQLRADLGYALKQTEALRTRVNFMALRNREKMEKLDQMRGAAMPHVYANRRNTWGPRPAA